MKDERQDQPERGRVAGAIPVETGDPGDEIETAQWLFREYVGELRARRDALAARDWDALDPAELKRATETAKTVRQAIHLLMEERQKIEKYRKTIIRGGGNGLDLDAARAEIGRRLACLRRAGAG